MPYQIGGVNIRTLAETAATSDPREATGFTNSKYLYQGYTHQDWFGEKMIMNYAGYIYSKEMGIQTRYLRNSSTFFSVSAKGHRPAPTYARRRWESSTPNTYYVNKFSDGEVWVSTTFNSRTGTRISTAAENRMYVFVILIGPGGGGGGGNGTKAGGGGGGGAFAYFCHRLVVGRVHRIYIGEGGAAGARNSNGGGSDNCQFATFTDISLSASITMINAMGGGGGQSGGNDGNGGSGGSIVYPSANDANIQRLDERTGTSGGNRGGNAGGSTPALQTQTYSPEAHRLDYGQGAGGASAGGSGSGGGGGWYLGHNGGSATSAGAGNNGGIGSGGGSGAWALFAGYAGGKGGNGYAALFY